MAARSASGRVGAGLVPVTQLHASRCRWYREVSRRSAASNPDARIMAAPNSIPVPRKDFVFSQMDGEALLYRHSVNKTIHLNESAAAVWQLCDGERTVQQLVDVLADAFPDARAEIAGDVHQAVDELYAEGALRLESRPAAANKESGGQTTISKI